MRGFLLFCLFAVGAWCAPLGEQADQNVAAAADDVSDNDIRVKRAKEAIMFGNQQNEAKEMKKRVDPEIDNATVDKGAKVIVKDPVEVDRIVEVEGNGASGPEETKVVEEEVEQPAIESEEEETIIDEAPTDTAIQSVNSDEVDQKTVDENEIADIDYQEYLKQLNEDEGYLSQYYNMLNRANVRGYGPSNFYDLLPLGYLQPRYRRSQKEQFVASHYPRSALHLKRNHRAKRSFIYPYKEQNYEPLEDSYLNRLYTNYPYLDEPELVSDDDVDDDVIQDLSRYFNNLTPFDSYADDSYDDDDEFPWNTYSAPYKRQADLAYVPGIKRSRDFYPYFPEPGTHFQAFVPQKRSPNLDDYIDAYQKVMELAAALRANSYYPEENELEYQKKKK